MSDFRSRRHECRLRSGGDRGLAAGAGPGGLLGAVVRPVPRAHARPGEACRASTKASSCWPRSTPTRTPTCRARYGIRSIPNVKAFVDGEVVDEFLGALPESAVREFIDRVLPTPGELLRREAAAQAAPATSSERSRCWHRRPSWSRTTTRFRRTGRDSCSTSGAWPRRVQRGQRSSPLPRRTRMRRRSLARLQFADDRRRTPATRDSKRACSSNPDDLEARLALAKLYVSSSATSRRWNSCWRSPGATAVSATTSGARRCSRSSICWAARTSWSSRYRRLLPRRYTELDSELR